MGRLNYTNVSLIVKTFYYDTLKSEIKRKIEGAKLGQSVAKDLLKRIPPALGSKAALRDPVVEVDVSGKALTDEGLAEIASALCDSIDHEGPKGKVVRLEEISLKDSGLTAASLQALASITRLACNDLRDFDLSGNNITVNTREETLDWESFLAAFSNCCVLRRIDLSGNALGVKAFEVLTRVYTKEDPVDLVLPDHLEVEENDKNEPSRRGSVDLNGCELRTRKTSIASQPEKNLIEENEESVATHGRQKALRHGTKSPEKGNQNIIQADLSPLWATTRGLRSVPYIILSNTSMTEVCALHLSYIVASQNLPQQLLTRVPPAKAGPHAQQLIAYDESSCRGIIYLPNATIGNAGMKVLDLSEAVRDGLLEDFAQGDFPDAFQTPAKPDGASRRFSEAWTSTAAIAATNRRRNSTISGFDPIEPETGGSALTELDRARSRIQGNAMQEAGQHLNDLWRVALNMLSLSRDIQLQTKRGPPSPPKVKPPIIKTLEIPGAISRVPKPLLTVMLPLALGNPNQALSPRNSQFRKKSGSIPPTPTIIPPTPQILRPIRQETKDYRSNLPCGFHQDAWRRILGLAAGADGILSVVQQRSVLRWAMDRTTMTKERDSLGLKESAQIWKVLDGMGCLAYEMDE